jgi:hypothetical protein
MIDQRICCDAQAKNPTGDPGFGTGGGQSDRMVASLHGCDHWQELLVNVVAANERLRQDQTKGQVKDDDHGSAKR